MPAVSPSRIVNSIIDAISQSGGTGVLVSERIQEHPRRFVFDYQGNSYSLWAYIWTITHGGRPTLPHEYRIQMTSVQSPLPQNPHGKTVLIGYEPDTRAFAGFDLSMHRTFTQGSPSVQIDIRTIRESLVNGIAISEKDNHELTIGIRPDHFITYVLNSDQIHHLGTDKELLSHITTVLDREGDGVPEEEIEKIDREERQKLVTTVQRNARSAAFTRQVINAYENRCAITRRQLRLVDAAHIIPVAVPTSPDHVTNGIALSPTFHRAYDNALIYFDTDRCLQLNRNKVSELEQDSLNAGIDYIEQFVGERIHLPADKNQWPNPDFISEGNKFRRIPGF